MRLQEHLHLTRRARHVRLNDLLASSMARGNSLTIHSESGICPCRVLTLRANCGSKEEMDLARVDYTEDRGSLHLVVSIQFQSRK
jgi:hypothetical protein